jgi:hypothetical protein
MGIIDVFVMETNSVSETRQMVENIAGRWHGEVEKGCDFRLNFRTIFPHRYNPNPMFAAKARQEAFTCEGSEIFILTDNDMLPFNAEHIKIGIEAITDSPDFAILSAWPEPHWIDSIELPGRTAINNDHVLEAYSVGGFRFCRKIPELIAPLDDRKGYDGVFCRHLWDAHQKRVGYLKHSKAFHLGAHCTELWKD